MKTTYALPISDTVAVTTAAEVGEIVRDAATNAACVYPLGGQTSLDYGLPAKREGIGISLAELNRVVDYPARDMTITVEAGITMQALAETLARENQMLPIDVPHADRATLGGVIACNWNGPRRYGHGSLRDYVIGISAVDGTGRAFKGGGRVVKNVAGYDFCKLLTGSLGTLGVITQATLKVRPRPQRSSWLVARARSLSEADKLLSGLATSSVTQSAIELLCGPEWKDDAVVGPIVEREGAQACAVAVALEGTEHEVRWMIDELGRQWQAAGVDHFMAILDDDSAAFWQRVTQFSQHAPSPLVIKASLTPSGVARFVSAVREIDANASLQCHAGNGIVIARFSEFPAGGLSRTLLQKLTPIAAQAQGHVSVLSNPEGTDMTRVSAWGGEAPMWLMSEVKWQFDPQNVLNPGRFVYG